MVGVVVVVGDGVVVVAAPGVTGEGFVEVAVVVVVVDGGTDVADTGGEDHSGPVLDLVEVVDCIEAVVG